MFKIRRESLATRCEVCHQEAPSENSVKCQRCEQGVSQMEIARQANKVRLTDIQAKLDNNESEDGIISSLYSLNVIWSKSDEIIIRSSKDLMIHSCNKALSESVKIHSENLAGYNKYKYWDNPMRKIVFIIISFLSMSFLLFMSEPMNFEKILRMFILGILIGLYLNMMLRDRYSYNFWSYERATISKKKIVDYLTSVNTYPSQ